MARGRPRIYQGPLRKGERSARVQAKGLNNVESKQVASIARKVVKNAGEDKYRAWLYPKTKYSELGHNKPFFLFGGDDATNGLLNLAKGDDSRPTPDGGGLPNSSPGQCREGQAIKLKALTHRCILSGDGPNKNTMVRLIMFSYPVGVTCGESDILLQPTGTGAGQGFPNIFLAKNTYNNKGIKFLMDKTYQLNGVSSGAVVEAEVGTNWGLSGVKVFNFNKYFKNKNIKYQEVNGQDNPAPAIDNYGIMIIPYGSGVSTENENCGRIEILGNMIFSE